MSTPVAETLEFVDEEALVEEPLLDDIPARYGRWRWRGLAVCIATGAGLALGAHLSSQRSSIAARVAAAPLSTAVLQLHKARNLALTKAEEVLEEIDRMECLADWMGMDLCGPTDADPSVMCKQTCVRMYQRLVNACPSGHEYAKTAAERLAECDVAPVEVKQDALDTDEELAMEEARLCVPKLLKFVIKCGVHDRQNMDPQETLCSADCQDSLEEVKEKCIEAWPVLPELEILSNVCRGCGSAIMEMHNPSSFVGKSCGTEKPDWFVHNACEENCHPYVCDLLQKCDVDVDLEVPGVSKAHLQHINTQLTTAIGECPC